MPIKILFGAIIGAALMFGAGYLEHEKLNWVYRQLKQPKDVSALLNSIKQECPDSGVYAFPQPPADMATRPPDEQKKLMEDLAEEHNKGRYGFLVSPQTSAGYTWSTFLIYQGVTDFVACLLASFVVAMTRPNIGFFGRWLVVVFIGLFSWVAVHGAYYTWYHFAQEYLLDHLFCTLLESATAGIAIAAIVTPRDRIIPGF